MTRRSILFAIAGACACASQPPPHAGATQEAPAIFAENPFGVTGAPLFLGDTADPNESLNLLRSGNIGWVRMDIDWSVAGADSAHYDSRYLAEHDAIAARASQIGVNVCMGLAYTPHWVHPGFAGRQFAPYPRYYRRWTQFVIDMVHRYSALGVHCYSIWNEPNSLEFFAPVVSQSSTWWTEYETLLLLASGAIRATDSAARVVGYELAYGPSKRLERELEASLDRVSGAIDVVGIHYYAPDPQLMYDAMVTRIPSTNPLIRRQGLELWLTDANAPVGLAPQDSAQTGTWVKSLMAKFVQRPDTSSWNKTFVSSLCADPDPGHPLSIVSHCPTADPAKQYRHPWPPLAAMRSVAAGFREPPQRH